MTESEFIKKLKEININITDDQIMKFNRYYELLVEWNEKINLTAITKKEDIYLKHFYDSATISKIIDLNKYESLCDIGTGAGFPGLVIKILYPNLKVTLIDSLNKRVNFLNEVIKELNLEKIEAMHYRVEEYGVKNREIFDIVTSRAVATLNVLLEYSIPMLKVGGYFIAMKANVDEELVSSHNALKVLNAEIKDEKQFFLPIENSNRTLLKIEKKFPTPLKYPRKYNEIKKKSL